MKLNGVVKRKTERRAILINYVKRHWDIVGQFPSAYEVAVIMHVDVELASSVIAQVRKNLYAGGGQ